MNVDSSIYISITQGITRGQILYKDLADNKGPLLYFISVPGFYLFGITGIWITELILMFITLYFMYKIALFFTVKKSALFSLLITSLAMHPLFYVNAGAEQYSLPFIAISLFIFTKYFISNNKINSLEIIIFGICFACSIMIRFNMFTIWAGFCFAIFLKSIIEKKYIELLKYIFFFSVGIFIVFIPILLYFYVFNIFDDFYYNVILGGITRGFRLSALKDLTHNFYLIMNRGLSYLPLCIGIIWIFLKYKNINIFYYLGFIFSYLLSILFLSFAIGNSHYNLILLPYFILVIVFLFDILINQFSKLKYRYLAVLFIFCVLFSEGIVRLTYYLFINVNTGPQLKIAGKIIDDNTNPDDKIINLGWNGYIYPYTKRSYASKYIFQSEAFDHIPGAREEFISDIKNNKPRIITIVTFYDDGINEFNYRWHEEIYDIIRNDYTLISDEYSVKIYLLN